LLTRKENELYEPPVACTLLSKNVVNNERRGHTYGIHNFVIAWASDRQVNEPLRKLGNVVTQMGQNHPSNFSSLDAKRLHPHKQFDSVITSSSSLEEFHAKNEASTPVNDVCQYLECQPAERRK
jgi:hypothetical protein